MTITAGTTATLTEDLYNEWSKVAEAGETVDVIYVRPQGFKAPRATVRVASTPQLQVVSTECLEA